MDFIQMLLAQNPQALDQLAGSSLDPKAFFDGISAGGFTNQEGGLGAALGGGTGALMEQSGLGGPPSAPASPTAPLDPKMLQSLMQQPQRQIINPGSPAGGRSLQSGATASPQLQRPQRLSLAQALGGR